MNQFKLTIAYDGTSYHGWQVQPGLPTIQGTLSDAIYRAIRERVLPQGSGRTDAGVHALGQVASFALRSPIPPDRLQLALNRCLPPSIRILSAEIVTQNFHARHSAIRKTYEYRIFPLRERSAARDGRAGEGAGHICPPTLAPFVWPCPWPLDAGALNEAAAHVLGTHDFTSFAASDPDFEAWAHPPALVETGTSIAIAAERAAVARTPVRTIERSEWSLRDGLYIYRVTATGFLHHMVRNLVGTFVQVGSSRLSADSIPMIIAKRDRGASGPTAPASGLFLIEVEYGECAGGNASREGRN